MAVSTVLDVGLEERLVHLVVHENSFGRATHCGPAGRQLDPDTVPPIRKIDAAHAGITCHLRRTLLARSFNGIPPISETMQSGLSALPGSGREQRSSGHWRACRRRAVVATHLAHRAKHGQYLANPADRSARPMSDLVIRYRLKVQAGHQPLGRGASMALRVQALSIVDAIADDIRGNLFSGALQSDTQLTEAEVAAGYEVARPTAKAAIEKLVAEGLLLRGTHKTARVPAIGADEVRDLDFARVCIESEVVGVAHKPDAPGHCPPGQRRSDRSRARFRHGGCRAGDPFPPRTDQRPGQPAAHQVVQHADGRDATVYGADELPAPAARPGYRRGAYANSPGIASGNPDGAVAALQDHLRKGENRIVPTLEALVAKARESQRG